VRLLCQPELSGEGEFLSHFLPDAAGSIFSKEKRSGSAGSRAVKQQLAFPLIARE